MTNGTRREFFGGMLGLAAGWCLTPAGAIEPIRRTGKPTFKLSLAAYSMRQYLNAKPGSKGAMDLHGFLDFCAGLGLHGAELTSYYFPKQITAEYLNGLKLHAHKEGLAISGGAIGNDYCHPPGPQLDSEIELTRRWIEHYAALGAPAIRVFAGRTPKGDSEDAAVRRCIGVLERVCALAGERGIMLALENHGGITARASQILKIVRAVSSPWFGVNFDSGNFRDSDDPYAELAEIAPYAVNAQVKTEIARRGKAEPADMGRIVDVLRQGGYSGWIALEYEAKEDPYEAIPRHVEQLRKLVG